MNKTSDCREDGKRTPAPSAVMAIEGLLTEDDFDEMIVADPYVINPSSRCSDRELNKVLAVLDELKGGEG
jgi:hypothetical protein